MPNPVTVHGLKGITSTTAGTPAPGSTFSKMQIGMCSKQLTDLIGQPNDQKSYVTGKASIPFHFGGDTERFEYFYKDEGALTLADGAMGSSTPRLIKITLNTADIGYVR